MKKECIQMEVLQPTSMHSRDWSPHRSTTEMKEWCGESSLEEFALGDSTTSLYCPRRFTAAQFDDETCRGAPPSIEMPQLDTHPAMDSEESPNAAMPNFLNEEHHDFAPIPRNISLEMQDATENLQQDWRPKRQRGSSIIPEESFAVPMQEEEDDVVAVQPRKRRRVHTRHHAMDSADFDAIFRQVGM